VTWFRVDDTLSGHLKAREAGLPAMGLWVMAGSWSSQQLTDGAVPDWLVRDLKGGRHAEALIEAGLWHYLDDGYVFHEWEQANPTRAEVLDARARSAQRSAQYRSRQASPNGRHV
jgi:hypothetical protein